MFITHSMAEGIIDRFSYPYRRRWQRDDWDFIGSRTVRFHRRYGRLAAILNNEETMTERIWLTDVDKRDMEQLSPQNAGTGERGRMTSSGHSVPIR
ncbi:hypothetical protein [Pectobacterium zantedeschiae]|uniref:hypothetical protein n=1 Tax=Pectobacterium zantedeschiae TaxID=2034769 RepID=UPI0013EC5EAE